MAPGSLNFKSSAKFRDFQIFHICWYKISQSSTSILHHVSVGFCTSLEHQYSHLDYNHWSSAYATSVWSSLAFNHLSVPKGCLPLTLNWPSYFSSVSLQQPPLSLKSHSYNTYTNSFCLWSVSILDCEPLHCKDYMLIMRFTGKESTCQCKRHRFDPWVGKIPWRRKWQPTPVFLPGKSIGKEEPGGPQSMGSQKNQI